MPESNALIAQLLEAEGEAEKIVADARESPVALRNFRNSIFRYENAFFVEKNGFFEFC